MKFYYPKDMNGNVIGFKTPESQVYDASGTSLTDKLSSINSSLSTVANAVSKKSSSVTLAASSWTGSAAPYSITVTVSGITTTNDVIVTPSSSLTVAQEKAMVEARITNGTQAANSLTLKAYGKKPTIDLPIVVLIKGV